MSVPRSVYDAVPYGATLHFGQTVLAASGQPAAFNLDNNTLWPVSCSQMITDNHSSVITVASSAWLSHPKGPGLLTETPGGQRRGPSARTIGRPHGG